MEGRLGIYAKNLTTGEVIAINADKPFSAPDRTPNTTRRSADPPYSPREAESFQETQLRWVRTDKGRNDRHHSLLKSDRAVLGGGISPTIEIGGEVLPGSLGVAGWAACPAGDMVFAVLAADLSSEFTGAQLFPEIVEACFRRLVPAFVEKPFERKPAGLLFASLHEAGQDPKLFPRLPEASAAESRAASQRTKFRSGEVARIAVLARPAATTIATVQWWSPAERPEGCSSKILDAGLVGDAVFDQPVDKLGLWRVRVAFGDVIVLDEKFYVTVK